MALTHLSWDDLDRIHEALSDPGCQFAVGNLVARVPREKLRFNLEALEASGLLEIQVSESQIRLVAPFSPDRCDLVIPRFGGPHGSGRGSGDPIRS